MSVESLLQKVSGELKAVRAARERYAVKLSPDFNCFDYIRPNELRLSRILADLLNPKGGHAQGNRFLDAFLRQIDLDSWVGEEVESVKQDDPTHNGRRVDVRIRWNDGRELVIENKPWAKHSEHQLHDYIDDLLKREVGEWRVVYLGGASAEPSEISLPAETRTKWESKLTLTTYGDLIVPWLTKRMGRCGSERFRWFLGEFKAYVLAEFEGERDMVVQDAAVKAVEGYFETAFQIKLAVEDIQKKRLVELKRKLESLVDGRNWALNWNIKVGAANEGFDVSYIPGSNHASPVRCQKA